jgi:O-antigen/teichoic acid export membrane protein
MNLVRKAGALWNKDQVLGRVVRNSGYLFVSNVITALLSIFTANLLGVEKFGALSIAMAVVSNVNRLLSFRMGDLVVRYMGDALAHEDKQKAAAIAKAAALVEGCTSLIAFLILVLLAPFCARFFIKDPSTTPLIIFYGLSIPGMLSTETATGILQVGNKYKSQSLINMLQAVASALVFVYAAVTHSGIWIVALAYLVGKLVAGSGPMIAAWNLMKELAGPDWIKAPFSLLPPRRELIRFGLSTNFSGTINMIVRDSELLWVGAFFTPTVAGYYRTALAVINLVILPINPFIATTYPEITRAISLKMWAQLKKLLRRVTLIAGGWTLAVAAGLILLGKWALFTPWIPFAGKLHSIYKPEYLPALPLILVILIGYGIANAFYWNRSLLLAMGLPDAPLWVSFWGMLIKVVLTIPLVPRLGYVFQAWLLSAYLAITVLILLFIGLRAVSAAEAEPV